MIKKEDKNEIIDKLRKKRDKLWKDFCNLPKKGSFSGLQISHELNVVQQKLDKLEGDKKTKRYFAEINIEVG